MIALLIVVGGFLAFCGLGMTNALVVALGIILAAAGPVLILVLNSRNKVRQYVYGTARVADISPRPTTDGRTARGRLKLVVRATGVNGVTVSTVDPAIPLDKWPDAGADPARPGPQGQPAQARRRLGQGPVAPGRPGVGAPAHRRQRAPLLPGRRRARRHRLPDRRLRAPAAPAGAAHGPAAAVRAARRRPAARRPAHAHRPAPDHGAGHRAGPAVRPGRPDRADEARPATDLPRPDARRRHGSAGTGRRRRAPAGRVGRGAPAAGRFARVRARRPPSRSPSRATSGRVRGAGMGPTVAAEQAGARPQHAAVVTEDTPPMVVRLPSNPVRGGARRRPSPRPRPGTHDRGPGRHRAAARRPGAWRRPRRW